MRKIVLLVLCLLLAACGDSNPLIGKWEGSVDISNDTLKQSLQAMGVGTDLKVQFTDKEMIVVRGGKEERQAIRYRVEKDKVYISDDADKDQKTETWQLIPMKDKDTIELPLLAGITATLKRSK